VANRLRTELQSAQGTYSLVMHFTVHDALPVLESCKQARFGQEATSNRCRNNFGTVYFGNPLRMTSVLWHFL